LTLVRWVADTRDGTRLRINHVSAEQAAGMIADGRDLAEEQNIDFTGVYVLAAEESDSQVTYERAVELRNRSKGKLILLVPDGNGTAGSSLDNSFQHKEFADLVGDASREMREELCASEELKSVIVRLQKHGLLPPKSLATLDFFSSIRPERSVGWGEELWRIGIIPDRGPGALERLHKNVVSAREIAAPRARGSSVGARLSRIQLVESEMKSWLVAHLSARPLHDPKLWAKSLAAEERRSLTFDRWIFRTDTEVSLVSIEIVPFVSALGNPQAWSGLKASADDLLVLPMKDNTEDSSSGTMGVKWRTNPTIAAGVASFRVEVVPSQMAIDLGADPTPVAEEITKASGRQQRITLNLGPEHAPLGDRFVIKVSALDDAGQVVTISRQEVGAVQDVVATVTSDEFKVEVTGFEADVYERQPSASSVAAARLDANLDGEVASAPEKVAWDDDAQLLSIRFGASKSYSVKYSSPLRSLEQMSMRDLKSLHSFSFDSDGLELISEENVLVSTWNAPKALLAARKKLFEHLDTSAGDGGLRGLVAANWDSQAITLGLSYLASYRRALEVADSEMLKGLLRSDTLSLRMRTGQGNVKAMVLLPSHPLRIGWMAKFEELLQAWGTAVTREDKKSRAQKLDVELAKRISPANLPYILVDEEFAPYVYHSELTFGSGLYLAISHTDVESVIPPLFSALRLPKKPSGDTAVESMLERKISEYREVHTLNLQQLSVNAVNPGDGSVLASAIDRSLGLSTLSEEVEKPVAVKVASFSQTVSATDPVPKLRELQTVHSSSSFDKRPSFLVPPFSLSSTSLDQLHLMRPANLGVLQGLSAGAVSMVVPADRSPLLRGLISPLEVTRASGSKSVEELAVLAALKTPRNNEHNDLPQAHLTHQLAVGRVLGLGEGVPALSMNVTPAVVEAIKALHKQSDWVVTIDRNVGATTFEELVRPHLPDSVLLDYAPDFVDGFSDRLSVTTTHRGEIDLALRQGMDELGLGKMGRGPKDIVKSLTDISGRLVLRLYRPNSLAREAVGLAAVMAYLEKRRELQDTIIIPLDAHPEIFAPSRRDLRGNALRCDLMLIRLTRRSFKIELVEVKARKTMNKPDGALNAYIENQLKETERFLRHRVLPLEGSRIDSELQWVRAVSLMHFYAERAAYAGRISRE
jgi:hypothetical protein